MKFRQRVAWLLLFMYLLATLVFCFYLFEISSYFGELSSANAQRLRASLDAMTFGTHPARTDIKAEPGVQTPQPQRLVEIPLPLLICIGAILYIQMFCVLYACTRSTLHCHPFLVMLPILGCVFLLHGTTTQKNLQAKARTNHSLTDSMKLRTNVKLLCESPAPIKVVNMNSVNLENS